MLKSITIAVMLISIGAFGQVPQPILGMNKLPNAAELHLVYCGIFNSVCVDRVAICYGQCGDQSEADDTGYACAGDIRGYVPYGFHYAKWYAVYYKTHKRIGGLATRGYNTKNCHNPR